jgi:hypothetical protein
MNQLSGTCVLLFSGGRDSTIGAIKLSDLFERLILVTVTSQHLVGMDAVYRRLAELKPHLSSKTKWIHALQPTGMPGDQLFRAATCLPCHRSYTAMGAVLAKRFKADSLAFGYTSYQSTWAEQTPYAIDRLKHVLLSRGIRLILPVYDIASKNDAIAELEKYHLSPVALEQKCIQQQFNIALDQEHLKEEIELWDRALVNALAILDEIQALGHIW